MATQYFFAHGEAQYGPYSASEMQSLAAAGKIERADTVWRQGIGQPIPAARVKLLFQDLPAPADLDAADGAPTELAPEQTDSAETRLAAAAAVSTPAAEKAPPKVAEKDRPRRVVSIKGGVLISQDGRQVLYRKKCDTCGNEEQNRTTAVIRPGAMNISYFCRKCRKGRTVHMIGIS